MKKTSIDNEDIVSSQDENEVGVSAVFQEYRTECFLRSTMDIYSSHSHFQCIGGKSTFCEKISSLICSEVSIAFGI